MLLTKKRLLKKEQQKSYEKSKICYICKDKIKYNDAKDKKYHKFKDHCYHTE